jgi:hypothetical protein
VRSPLAIVASLSLTLALGGCALTRTSTTAPNAPTGAAKQIDVVVEALATDASDNDASAICSKVLSTALVDKLNKAGGCKTDITNQLQTINDFTLTIGPVTKGVSSRSRTATARIETIFNGKDQINTLQLVNQRHGGWRINSLQ